MDNILKPMSYTRQMEGSLFSWKTSLLLYHTMKECQVANCHGQASDAYAYVWMMQCSLFSRITLWNLCHTLNRCKVAYFHGILHDSYTMQWRNVMDNTLKPMSYTEQMEGSLFSWETSWNLYHVLKECQVANFHGQASDAYADVWMMQGSLFSWITLWNLCHTLNRCKVTYFHGKLHDSYTMQWRNYSDYQSTSLCLYSFTLCANINFIAFGLTRSWIETTVYRTWCEYPN
jgi:hypothetical protein